MALLEVLAQAAVVMRFAVGVCLAGFQEPQHHFVEEVASIDYFEQD